jgi:cytochrome c-type biogenesis protein CcmF
MTVELGHFALILAFALALVQGFFGLAGATTRREPWMAAARSAVAGQLVFTLFSFCVGRGFLVFLCCMSPRTPIQSCRCFIASRRWERVKVGAAVVVDPRCLVGGSGRVQSRHDAIFINQVLGVLSQSAVAALFIIASTPGQTAVAGCRAGRDLNPLCRIRLGAHPPLLYIGYVGLAIPFACSVAALMEGKLDSAWARWVRPWTTLSWLFLTLGIALGSFWAYYELGWGGWWFWDPVENASFMPWLMSTALIHSLAVTEKRGLFKSWTALLAIFGFSLSLLGTFLVRSGVLVSVHAFASDPSRGLFILIFLALCIGGALTLYAWRAPLLKSEVGFAVVSRESFLLFNNVLLVVAAALILLGTLYPLFIDA